MTETFKNFKPLDDVFLLSEHTAVPAFASAAAKKPVEDPFVSPALLQMIASPKEQPSSGRLG